MHRNNYYLAQRLNLGYGIRWQEQNLFLVSGTNYLINHSVKTVVVTYAFLLGIKFLYSVYCGFV